MNDTYILRLLLYLLSHKTKHIWHHFWYELGAMNDIAPCRENNFIETDASIPYEPLIPALVSNKVINADTIDVHSFSVTFLRPLPTDALRAKLCKPGWNMRDCRTTRLAHILVDTSTCVCE